MQANELISNSILPIKPNENGETALLLMDKFRVNHIPIVNNDFYLGIISDKEINNWDSKKESISDHLPNIAAPHVIGNQHLFDIIEVLEKNNLSVVPVLDNNQKYEGVITNRKLLYTIANSSAIQSDGGVIVIEMHKNDYSLTEISSIIENNNAKILSSYITSIQDSSKIEVTLKINNSDITSIIKHLERHGYSITASYKEDEKDIDYLDRYEQLMRFLNP